MKETISKQLQTIAENTPKVYDAGYQKGKADGKAEGIEQGYADGFEAGKLAVKDSPLPIEVATESEMTAILESATAESVGAIYKYTGEGTDTYTNGGLYIIEAVE